MIKKAVRLIETAALAVCGLLIATTMIIGALDVVLGLGFNHYIAGKVELSEVLIAAATFLALPGVTWHSTHIRVDIVSQNFRGWFRVFGDVVVTVVALATCAFFSYTSWLAFESSWAKTETAQGLLPVPVYPVKFAAFAAFAICGLIAIVQFLRLVIKHRAQKTIF